MSVKIGYSYEESNGNTLTGHASESESATSSQVDLVRWIGMIFLERLYKIEKHDLTLNVRISDETPEQLTFIADLLFKGLTNRATCVTKLNVEPQNLFTTTQYEQIHQRLAENQKTVRVSKKEQPSVQVQTNKTELGWVNRWQVGFLMGLTFAVSLAFSNLLTAVLLTAGMALVAKAFSSRQSKDNSVNLGQSDVVPSASSQVDAQNHVSELVNTNDYVNSFNQFKARSQLTETINPSDELGHQVKIKRFPS